MALLFMGHFLSEVGSKPNQNLLFLAVDVCLQPVCEPTQLGFLLSGNSVHSTNLLSVADALKKFLLVAGTRVSLRWRCEVLCWAVSGTTWIKSIRASVLRADPEVAAGAWSSAVSTV